MAARNGNLTDKRRMEHEEREYKAKLAKLRAAIDEGDGSGVAGGDPFMRVRAALKLPQKRR